MARGRVGLIAAQSLLTDYVCDTKNSVADRITVLATLETVYFDCDSGPISEHDVEDFAAMFAAEAHETRGAS